MAERAAADGFEFSVATASPTRRQRQLALFVVVITFGALCAMIPFGSTPLPRFDSFIPSIMAIVFVTDLITALLLFGQFSATGSRALLVLACGYLFSSLIVIPHALTFPGAFAPMGLLGAGPQSAAYLSVSWRSGHSLALLAYALLISGKHTRDAGKSSPQAAIISGVMIVILVVGTLTWVATAGEGLLPSLLSAGAVLPLGHTLNGMVALTNMLTLLLLWTRGRSILDLWLMVAVFGLIGEGVMVAFFVTARFTFGFYAVRIISLVVSKVVLIVLLSETMILHARLSIANRHLQRERANRLTSAEAVVAAIAHEIRQPLTGISLLATAGQQHLDRASPDTGTANKLFGQIKDAAFRANEVFDGFLSLFREGRQDRQAVDVNTLTQEATHLLRKDLDDHNVIARTKLASDLPVVEGHSGQLREVILNLIQNSIEAMASTTNRPRILSITTSRLGAGAVFISLQDTGPGIEPQKLASIFDPFVTTKAKGTGLGLAICKMIVDQHRGKLSAASDGTDGTRFEITLPTRIAEPPPRRLLGNKASPSDLR